MNRRYLIALAIILAGLAMEVYATTFLTVNNTATIQTGASLQATGSVAAGTTCSAASGTYGTTPSVSWGSVTAGTTAKDFICVQNIGTSSYVVSITSNLALADGTITSPQTSQTIATGGFLLVEFDWAVSATAATGGVTFVITFQ